ncbi:MAG TPA: class II fructose-bisphosphatase [Anaerolineae bacterium]|nr:class II fructose-bisphosphatase [Anaerolineae bacterium]
MNSAQFIKDPDRNLALELVRVTESAAMAAARKMGRGDKNAADQAAVNAMRYMFNTVDMDGVVVIGEGEKDEAPMLYNGEALGTGVAPKVDIAVDPIDGTRLTSLGLPGAVAVVALAERGAMFSPGHIVYANKIAVGPRAKGVIDINAPVKDNLSKVAKALGKDVHDLTVVVLDRDRHKDLIREVRQYGARIKLISDGDVAGALATAIENSGEDILMGIGGTPEAVITAAALKCMDGEIQIKLWARNEKERMMAVDHGIDLNRVLSTNDLVSGENVFFAVTGITGGQLVDGVRYEGDRVYTSSIVMRSLTATVRRIESEHHRDRLNLLTQMYE